MEEEKKSLLLEKRKQLQIELKLQTEHTRLEEFWLQDFFSEIQSNHIAINWIQYGYCEPEAESHYSTLFQKYGISKELLISQKADYIPFKVSKASKQYDFSLEIKSRSFPEHYLETLEAAFGALGITHETLYFFSLDFDVVFEVQAGDVLKYPEVFFYPCFSYVLCSTDLKRIILKTLDDDWSWVKL